MTRRLSRLADIAYRRRGRMAQRNAAIRKGRPSVSCRFSGVPPHAAARARRHSTRRRKTERPRAELFLFRQLDEAGQVARVQA